MSLLFADSFDGVITGPAKWSTWHGSTVIDEAYGRHGKGILCDGGTGIDTMATRTLDPATNRVTVGLWLYGHNSSYGSNDAPLRLTSSDGSEISVCFDASLAHFEVYGTGVARQVIGPAGIGQRHTWIFVELMWEPGVAYEVRANTLTIASGTPGGSGTPNAFLISHGGGLIAGGAVVRIDDIYIVDSAAPGPNGFLGPVKIANLKPDGAGDRTELTATPAGNNWERVSDGDDDTYVEGDPGDGDLYTFDDLSGSDDVLGVVQYWRAFDSEGGAITARAISRVDGTEYDGDDVVLPGSVATHVQPWDVNPDTGQPWTPAEVDGAEFGVEFA